MTDFHKSDPFWVYILENARGEFYVGQTKDVDTRVRYHNTPVPGQMSCTHKHGPWTLVWKEPHSTRGSAVVRERQIKRMKSARWIRENLLGQDVAGC